MPFLKLFCLRFKLVYLGLSCEYSAVAACRAAGKGTAGVDLLTVKRDRSYFPSGALGRRACGIYIFKYRDRSEKGCGYSGVFLISGNKLVCISDESGTRGNLFKLAAACSSLHGCDRIESRASRRSVFQGADRAFCAFLVFHDNSLNCPRRARSRPQRYKRRERE